MDASSGGAIASASSAKAPRSTTLFHQDAQLELVQDAELDHASAPHRDANAPALVFQCDALVKVRSEYWNRPLKLLVRIAPTAASLASSSSSATAVAAVGLDTMPLQTLALDPSASDFFLTDARTHDHVLRLIRDEPSATQPLTRSIERLVRISKPLQLKIETRYLSNDRVCIVAKASNTHTHVALTVVDLHLHLNESYASTSAPSTAAASSQRRSLQRQFRVVNEAPEQFPVRLRSAEQHNFLFVIEATQSGDSDDDISISSSGDSGDSTSDNAVNVRNGHEQNVRSASGDTHERAASMSRRHPRAAPGGPMKRHSSSGSVVHSSNSSGNSSNSNNSTKQHTTSSSTAALKKPTAPATASTAAGATQTQQTLLTLSWEVSSSDTGAPSRPITELHTIIWSPQSGSGGRVQQGLSALSIAPPLLPATTFTALVARSDSAAGVTTVHLSAQSALRLSLAPLSSQQQAAATGDVVTLCLVIANCSRHMSFDLTLLAPFASDSASGSTTGTEQQLLLRAREPAPSWFSFEATHRLGCVDLRVESCLLDLRLHLLLLRLLRLLLFLHCTCLVGLALVLVLPGLPVRLSCANELAGHVHLCACLYTRVCRVVLCCARSVVAPGMTVRKSVRVVLLRYGKCDLSRFALFDRYSSTCFVPSTAALASTSTSDPGAGAAPVFVSPPASSSWEVFVAH